MNFLKMRIEYFLGSLILVLGLLLNNFRDELFANSEPYWWCQAGILFLTFYELAVVFIIDKKYKSVSPRQSINLLMGLKIGRILFSGFFVISYLAVVKLETKRFMLVFLTIYLIFLVFDTLFIISRERKAKKQIKKNETHTDK
ncbi:MAG: hypothetical protein LBS54_03900 [Dysgonamonadaceae bacterium]|jgi:membrane protein YdbS with pleckstrin-like domain|nr:hypothetical protein [Dysgonamonadaceae bacterium]